MSPKRWGGQRSEDQQENEAMAVWFIYIIYIYISGMKPTMFERDYELVTNLDAYILTFY